MAAGREGTDGTTGLRTLLARLPQSQDIGIALLLVMTVTLMILPMPTPVVDVLIGMNFGIAALLLMTAVYLKSPLDLSTLPGIILISTIFRLSLSVTTTRLILAEGDAGAIVRTFGEFVIAGNVVVGLVVFLIITIVQFMVVSKGAERVAEVGARFTLDAMPGKQMAIDAELRNGDIEQEEARELRAKLGRESQLYGAMDGAMKFVKGDAIAGLIITAINLIGGFAIGTAQRGLPFDVALREYSLLTVGDALIAQIPALLMAITAATIVTRVSSEKGQNLGRDISAQLFADPRALGLAGGLLVGMAALPGFPTAILLALAAVFGLIAFVRSQALAAQARAEAEETEAKGAAEKREEKEAAVAVEGPVMLRLSSDLTQIVDRRALQEAVDAVRASMASRYGIEQPVAGVDVDPGLEPGAWSIEVENVPSVAGTIARGADDPTSELAARVEELLTDEAASFIGIQEAKALFEKHEAKYQDIMREILGAMSLGSIAEVMRRLLDERVSLRNLRLVLEAMASAAPLNNDPAAVVEAVRMALARQISFQHADRARTIPALMLTPAMERAMLESQTGQGVVASEMADRLVAALDAATSARAGEAPVVLTGPDARRLTHETLRRRERRVAVLSQRDVAEGFAIRSVGTIDVEETRDGSLNTGKAA